MHAAATLVVNPGLRDAAPQHWQSLLAAQWRAALRPVIEVKTFGRDDPGLDKRVVALDTAVARAASPCIIAAHSGGCITVLHWIARMSPQRISSLQLHLWGVLLATPANLDRPLPAGYPDQQALADEGWSPVPRQALPIPSWVAVSENDPLGEREDILTLASAWGSKVVELGRVGHLNPASGFGPWPQALSLLEQLSSRT